MYPLYWTTNKKGIFMRYNYRFKKKCVEMYKSGVYPDTPSGHLNLTSKARLGNGLERKNL